MRDPVIFLISGAVTAVIGLGVNSMRNWYFSDARRFAAAACKAKISPQILQLGALPYVARAQVDAELGAFVKYPSTFINVVVGPRGVGKTTAVAHALEQTDGVLVFSVTGAHTLDTGIYAVLVDGTIGRTPSSSAALSQNQMVDYLAGAASRYRTRHPHATDWKPTIVFEVETKAQPATVGLAVQTMKNLVCDRAACYGFIVLGDAHAVYAMGSDTDRHRYVWLDDFTSAEADIYLDELGALTAADERELRPELYARASARAIGLSKLADELKLSAGKPARDVVRAFIDMQQKAGVMRVENLVKVAVDAAEVKFGKAGLHFIRLMKAMLKNGGSLPVTDAKYMCSEVGISDVLKLPKHHAISINTQTGVFTFYTPADRAAAEQNRV
ncbi:hypothetical protein KFE25_000341 [Diacronema lutheri]|uniref:Uncharacterized protein n=1 Tax=Diacronema lutheri TaxID=2081491 RepID=A0A8J5XSC9_DIALT|nr:hypothetical protein KFE25_000341 [Diacronema lutheri]